MHPVPLPEKTRSRIILVSFFGVLALVIATSLLFLPSRIKASREKSTYLAAQALYAAIDAAGTDRTPGGIGYPAESGAKNTKDYIAALHDKGYLKSGNFPLLSNLVLANTSEADPRDTVLFLSRAGYDRYVLHSPKKLSPTYLLCRLDGTIMILPIDAPPPNLPQRTPGFLEP